MNQLFQQKKVTLLKRGKFFLLRNSHSQYNYKNHSYFDNIQKQPQSKIIPQLKNNQIDKQFVDGSASFGINNTYHYLWNKSDIRSRLRQQWKLRVSTQQQKYQKINNNIDHKNYENNHNLQSITEHKEKDTKKSFRISINKNNRSRRVYTQVQNNDKKSILPNIQQIQKQQPSYPIQFIYSSNIKTYDQISKRTLSINFSRYLIKTFIKCKIDWNKIDCLDFNEIVRIIQIAQQYTHQIAFNENFLVNISTLSQFFERLANCKQRNNEWISTVRYFFIPSKKVDQFILQQFKDQVKLLMTTRLNIDIVQNQINFYDYESGKQLKSMLEILLSKKIVFDSHFSGYQNLKYIIKQYKQQIMYKERTQRWKNIVPTYSKSCENQPKIKFKNNNQIKLNKTFLTLNEEKYHKLYQKFKIKHQKYLRKGKTRQREPKYQFIQRQKLIKHQDAFQL